MDINIPTGLFFLTVGSAGVLGGLTSLFLLASIFGFGKKRDGTSAPTPKEEHDFSPHTPMRHTMREVVDLYLRELEHGLYNIAKRRKEYELTKEDARTIGYAVSGIEKARRNLYNKDMPLNVRNYGAVRQLEQAYRLLGIFSGGKKEDVNQRLYRFAMEAGRMKEVASKYFFGKDIITSSSPTPLMLETEKTKRELPIKLNPEMDESSRARFIEKEAEKLVKDWEESMKSKKKRE